MADIGELFGGLLEGAGGAIQAVGKAEREAALKQLEMDHEAQLQEGRDRAQHGYRVDEENVRAGHQEDNTRLTYGLMGDNQKASDERRSAADLKEIGARGAESRRTAGYESGLNDEDYTDRITLDDGTVIGVNKKGGTKRLMLDDKTPVRAKDKNADSSDGLTAGEQRAYNVFKADHTKVDDLTGEKTVDTDGLYRDMAKQNPRLYAKLKGASSVGGGGQRGAPPREYPDAKWSDKAGGWVVQKNGKWFKVTE